MSAKWSLSKLNNAVSELEALLIDLTNKYNKMISVVESDHEVCRIQNIHNVKYIVNIYLEDYPGNARPKIVFLISKQSKNENIARIGGYRQIYRTYRLIEFENQLASIIESETKLIER